MTLETVSDTVRVYDVTDDGYARVERVTRERGATVSASTTVAGRVDVEALAAFPDPTRPVIDLQACDDDVAAFAKELVGA